MGGYNGGGASGCSTCTSDGGSGGGATDIRTSSSDITTRLVVAGGGGGADGDALKSWPGGNGGGLVGGSATGEVQNGVATDAFGGSQTSGGVASSCAIPPLNTAGTLGNGGTSPAGGGGGGGYYGGGGGCSSGGAGGSGYCDATLCTTVAYSVASSFGAGSVTLTYTVPVNIITTFAGSGTRGNTGGGPATSAQFYNPQGVFVDASGFVYIVDSNNNLVYIVRNGIIGLLSFGGTNLQSPRDIVVDVSGNMYVSSWGNYFIAIKRSIDSTTAAIYACSQGHSGNSGDGGPATSARCGRPLGMAIASNGDLYFADNSNDLVRLIKQSTGIITTVAGTGVGSDGTNPQVYGPDNTIATSVGIWPASVVLNEAAGLLYVMGYGSLSLGYRLSVLNLATGILKYVAGTGVSAHSGDGGPMSSAQICESNKIAIDQLGNVYIGEDNCGGVSYYAVRHLNMATGIITTIVGNGQAGYTGDLGPASSATLRGGGFLFVDNVGKFLYIGDGGNNVVRRVDISRLLISTPSSQPTGQPTLQPSRQPTMLPSRQPSRQPSVQPTSQPSSIPTQPSPRPSGNTCDSFVQVQSNNQTLLILPIHFFS